MSRGQMERLNKAKHILLWLVIFPIVFYVGDLYFDNLIASEHEFLPYLLSSAIGLMLALLFEQFVLQRLTKLHYLFKIVVIIVTVIVLMILLSELGIERYSLINLKSIQLAFSTGCILLTLVKHQSSKA